MRGRSWADMEDDEEYVEFHDNESSTIDETIISFPKPIILPSIKLEDERIKSLIKEDETQEEVNLLPMSCPWVGQQVKEFKSVVTIPSFLQEEDKIEILDTDQISVEVTDKRSRACKSVSSGEKCLKGSCCTFAHSFEELNPFACKFGMNCKFIFSDTKTCFFIHPEETKEMYCKRNLIFQQKKTAHTVEHSNSKRTEGFDKLSNVKETIRKTKICEVMVKYGKCKRQTCNFAHNSNEYKPDCVFGDSCKKKNVCTFRHHPETIEDYCDRMNIKLPKKF
jgi:hypothetical protein